MIDPAFKATWVAALRSGKYEQARNVLRIQSKSEVSYCCIGVACVKAKVMGHYTHNAPGTATDDFGRKIGLSRQEIITLVKMNDQNMRSFPEIADWIELNV